MADRALALGLGASLALHGLLLSLRSPEALDAPLAPASIVARLMEPQAEAAPAPAAPQRKTQRTVASPQAPEATTEGQYRYLLAAAAARHNAYPAQALANGWEGDVVVRVAVAASGTVSTVSVARGSGHAALDEQALQTFRRAAREVGVPRALRGRAFGVELKTTYRSG